MFNKILYLLLLVIAGFLTKDVVFSAISSVIVSIKGREPEKEQTVECKIGKIVSKRIKPSLNFTGSIAPVRTVDIKPDSPSYIEWINPADQVKKDDVVIRFSYEAKEHEMKRCKAQSEQAQEEYKIVLQQVENGTPVPDSQVKKAKLKAEQYEEEYQSKLADYKKSSVVKALFDANLGIPTKCAGSYLSHGERVISYSASTLVVQFSVPQCYMSSMIKGKEVTVRFNDGRLFKTKIHKIDVVQDDHHETLIQCDEVEANDLFKIQPKMTVTVFLDAEVLPNYDDTCVVESALCVPTEQDMRDQKRYIYIVNNSGRAEIAEIDILARQGGYVLIKGEGLKIGTLYLIEGTNNTVLNKKIRPVDKDSVSLLEAYKNGNEKQGANQHIDNVSKENTENLSKVLDKTVDDAKINTQKLINIFQPDIEQDKPETIKQNIQHEISPEESKNIKSEDQKNQTIDKETQHVRETNNGLMKDKITQDLSPNKAIVQHEISKLNKDNTQTYQIDTDKHDDQIHPDICNDNIEGV